MSDHTNPQTRKQFYHVAPLGFGIGDRLAHGRFGRDIRQYIAGRTDIPAQLTANIMWELALETAREAISPDAVSRLNCLFAWESYQMARAFHEDFRNRCGIYCVEPLPDTQIYRGDYGLITYDSPGGAYVDFMPRMAVDYWTRAPREHVEVLIGGPVEVVAVIEGFVHTPGRY